MNLSGHVYVETQVEIFSFFILCPYKWDADPCLIYLRGLWFFQSYLMVAAEKCASKIYATQYTTIDAKIILFFNRPRVYRYRKHNIVCSHGETRDSKIMNRLCLLNSIFKKKLLLISQPARKQRKTCTADVCRLHSNAADESYTHFAYNMKDTHEW